MKLSQVMGVPQIIQVMDDHFSLETSIWVGFSTITINTININKPSMLGNSSQKVQKKRIETTARLDDWGALPPHFSAPLVGVQRGLRQGVQHMKAPLPKPPSRVWDETPWLLGSWWVWFKAHMMVIWWCRRLSMKIVVNTCLVGGWATPLKNMKVSWGYYSQYDRKNNPNVPNHQPDVNTMS